MVFIKIILQIGSSDIAEINEKLSNPMNELSKEFTIEEKLITHRNLLEEM